MIDPGKKPKTEVDPVLQERKRNEYAPWIAGIVQERYFETIVSKARADRDTVQVLIDSGVIRFVPQTISAIASVTVEVDGAPKDAKVMYESLSRFKYSDIIRIDTGSHGSIMMLEDTDVGLQVLFSHNNPSESRARLGAGHEHSEYPLLVNPHLRTEVQSIIEQVATSPQMRQESI